MSDIESIFKQKLTNHEVKVSEGLWLSIANGLEKKKKGRRIFLLAVSVVITVMLLLLGFFYTIGNYEKSKLSSENNQIASINSTEKEKISNSGENFKDNKKSSEDIRKDNDVNSLKENTLSFSTKGTTEINNYRETNLSQTDILDNNEPYYSTTNNTKQSDFNTEENSYKNVKSVTVNNETLQNVENVVEVKTTEDLVNTDSEKISRKTQENICSILNRKSGIKMTKIPAIDMLSKLPISIKSGQLNTCSTINTNHFFVGVHFSPDFYSKNLYGDNKDFQLLRHLSEKSIFSMTAGLDIGYTFKNGAFVKTGVSYSQINEQFHHREIKSIKTIITIDTIIENGSTKITRDTTRKVIYGDNIEKPISFNMYDIPLIFGLQYGLTHNQKLAMNIGIIFNILSTNKGFIFNKDQKIVEFNSELPNQNIFKTNVGISIYSSFTYSYVINKNIDIFVEPKARFYINSFTKSGYPLGQKYNTFGLSFGTVYHFSKVGD